ncbi:MAG: UPF0175 family protein [Chlorobiales bacterium]|jgi:predicted HTH domain antitoxin|nr:UPF0175 family protein [Chlorobiales bacterium]
MNTVNISLPESLQINVFEVKMIVAAKLYEMGRLSAGQAAEIVGLSKRAFIEVLGKYDVSVFGYGLEDIENDLKNV